jgi:ABC-type multidrug transport system fused ATPase/permease subunit
MINGRPLNEIDWESYRRLIGYVPQEATLFSKTIEENVLFGRTVPSLTGEDAIPDESEMLRAAEPTLASRLVGDAVSEGIVAPGWRPLRRKRSRRDGTISPAELDARERAEEAWARRCLAVAQMESDLATLPDGAHTTVGQKGGLVSGGQKQRIAIARALAGSPQLLLLDDCTAALDARNEDRFWSDLEERFAGRTCFIVSHRLATIRRADVILVFEAGRLVDAGTHDELVVRCETYREFLQTERRREHLGITPGVA